MISLGQVRSGTKILFRNLPHEVLEANHLKMGRGGAKLQTKLRNLVDGAIIDYTFAGDERLEEAEVRFQSAQYLYPENQTAVCMINDTFETIMAPVSDKQSKFLKEGHSVDLMLWQDQVIGLTIPKKVELEVSFAEPAIKGNTVNAPTKLATLETGAQVQVPMFIKTGDLIRVNTETGSYDSRV